MNKLSSRSCDLGLMRGQDCAHSLCSRTLPIALFSSVAALLSPSALAQSNDADELETVTITAQNLYENVGYTRRSTTAGTRFELSTKEVPQSLSIITEQRIEDQDLQDIEEVLTNTTGVSASRIDSNRVSFYSRGFRINSYQYDGIPTLNMDSRWYFGEGAQNTAIYDRVEVVRGANGLMTGAGNPGASVNFVRKHADSRELTGSVSGTLGSWDQRRGVVDVTTPLTPSGDVRARFVGGYDAGDSYLDRYSEREKFGYAVIDADVTDNTTLSVGYDYQNTHASSPTWGGLPLWYSDGSETDYSRSFSVAPDWSYSDYESKKVFAQIDHRFGNGWELRGTATHEESDLDSRLMSPYYEPYFSSPDPITGQGPAFYTGWNRGERDMDSADAYVRGPFELFGREHELVFGGSYSDQSNDYENSFTSAAIDVGDFDNWDGSTGELDWPAFSPSESASTRQQAVYGVARFSLADPLTLIVGARYTDWHGSTWSSSLGNHSQGEDDITPYGGLIYDINDVWSTYLSYSEIFQPQSYRLAGGNGYLEPLVGKNYETGVKAAWFDGLLNASFSVFRLEQDNVADIVSTPGSLITTATPVSDVVSEGFEAELTGAVTDDLDMTVGFTHYTATSAEGSFNTDRPRTQANLFASYRVPQWRQLTIGGGARWQSDTFIDDQAAPGGTRDYEQSSYAVANVFGRYQFTPQLALQVNVKNLFDEKYYSYFDTYGVYGEPRRVTSTLTYSF
ncbi:ferric-rhodotorulic acid/ferric-coprogen receptor FhuE [Chromohalobacter canadensis]|uniref:Ferric-rhodotorulic acid/ferric-coprogen receptor FhuE n=1 Tax=Chromohalobacter canadensis TaxID=141389 RepID=A0A285VDK2_9GAMM|nr:ferric-rhodotorulic acid/ferric-coprogen receptor FhuE [Chromohalobacter canadensis]MCK0769341.1 ferric-rhodotorulic acid/ferric-coprogen receptor FhuE [Chromohalobacter canadensis]WQH10604.1 ferric-rhodotorulic acid/ferric-coprogen receptor FhuE [Chromohalobacter canadensis]SOC51156.1 outer-membrane receptor for ferric coprogen and ferric-rhodotorulic acid [Chromohalobacter canadensis]